MSFDKARLLGRAFEVKGQHATMMTALADDVIAAVERIESLEQALATALDGWDAARADEGYDPSEGSAALRSLLADRKDGV